MEDYINKIDVKSPICVCQNSTWSQKEKINLAIREQESSNTDTKQKCYPMPCKRRRTYLWNFKRSINKKVMTYFRKMSLFIYILAIWYR